MLSCSSTASGAGARRGLGIGSGAVEAWLLHALLRGLRPRRMIAIGSGVSSVVSATALAMNGRGDGVTTELLRVEPHVRPGLRALVAETAGASGCRIDLVQRPAQDVGLEVVGRLGGGDVLFIELQPRRQAGERRHLPRPGRAAGAAAGRLVRVHDLPYPYPTPYPTPAPERWIFKRPLLWTEAALLQAVLGHTAVDRIRLCTSYLHHKAPAGRRRGRPAWTAGGRAPVTVALDAPRRPAFRRPEQ